MIISSSLGFSSCHNSRYITGSNSEMRKGELGLYPFLNTRLFIINVHSISPIVVLGVFLQQEGQKDFLSWFGYLRGVSRYTLDMWELKSVLVLSNAQPFERGLPIYHRVCEEPFDIPQGYVKIRSIYRLVRGRNT